MEGDIGPHQSSAPGIRGVVLGDHVRVSLSAERRPVRRATFQRDHRLCVGGTQCESCADLASVSLSGGTIASATDVTEPFMTTSSGGSGTITVSVPFHFCRVAITLAPSTDS